MGSNGSAVLTFFLIQTNRQKNKQNLYIDLETQLLFLEIIEFAYLIFSICNSKKFKRDKIIIDSFNDLLIILSPTVGYFVEYEIEYLTRRLR